VVAKGAGGARCRREGAQAKTLCEAAATIDRAIPGQTWSKDRTEGCCREANAERRVQVTRQRRA